MNDDFQIKAVRLGEKRNATTRKITGSYIRALDWITDYEDPVRFNEEKELEGLFYEISKQRNVSDIIIRPDSPICVKIKGKGLKAVTHRVMDLIESEHLVKLLTANDSIFSEIRNGKPVSGLA